MATEAQIRANQENAQKSSGPTSIEGKKKSSMNAVTHGIFSNITILPGEDEVFIQRLREDILATYNASEAAPSPGTSSNTQWHNGFILGLGAEHYINDKISAKAEYRYADFGEKNANVPIEEYFNYRQNYDKENSIRIGLNYHF